MEFIIHTTIAEAERYLQQDESPPDRVLAILDIKHMFNECSRDTC
jgi:hypothetical protein